MTIKFKINDDFVGLEVLEEKFSECVNKFITDTGLNNAQFMLLYSLSTAAYYYKYNEVKEIADAVVACSDLSALLVKCGTEEGDILLEDSKNFH